MRASRSTPRCIIDNTNLARLRGSGRQAVIVPEMVAFAERYGFQFVCHELQHCDRKAGEERSFWTVETIFLPGRTFDSLEDLNRQARQWVARVLVPGAWLGWWQRWAQRVWPQHGPGRPRLIVASG